MAFDILDGGEKHYRDTRYSTTKTNDVVNLDPRNTINPLAKMNSVIG